MDLSRQEMLEKAKELGLEVKGNISNKALKELLYGEVKEEKEKVYCGVCVSTGKKIYK